MDSNFLKNAGCKKTSIEFRMFAFFLLFITFLSLVPSSVFSFDRVINYATPMRSNDFAFQGDTVWVATTGGLYCYRLKSGTGDLLTKSSEFPDPAITCLAIDFKGDLWMGTSSGYLYKRPAGGGRQIVLSAYFSARWPINDIITKGKYLIIASSKGCSVFDGDKMVALKNATGFGSGVSSSQVATLAIFRDTLILGCERAVAKLDISGNNLLKANFYDPSIWLTSKIDTIDIASIVVQPQAYQVLENPGEFFNGTLVRSDSIFVYEGIEPKPICSVPSEVTAIATTSKKIFIGTKNHYFYEWDGRVLAQHKIIGPTFDGVTRVHVDNQSNVWVLPKGSVPVSPQPLWEGISLFQNNSWKLYTPQETKGLGELSGGNYNNRGIAEDRMGSMWFGTDGGNVKKFERSSGTWSKYCINTTEYGGGQFFQDSNCASWGKCDAIACDSSGFLWVGVFFGYPGSLVCYDPRAKPDPSKNTADERHYRRFFPQGDPLYKANITSLTVDRFGNLIVGADNKIDIFSLGTNPLRDSIQLLKSFEGIGANVYSAISTPDGLTWIATSSFLYRFDPGTLTLTVADSLFKDVRAVQSEDDRHLWLGTSSHGLVRYTIIDSSKEIVDNVQGLMSSQISDLSIDRKNGLLWIATNLGVSSYSIGYTIGTPNSGKNTLVFPNPFSRRKHSQIIFQKLPPKASVLIYSASGSLVERIPAEQTSNDGSVCAWAPSRTVVPGVYLYVVNAGSQSSKGKLLITP